MVKMRKFAARIFCCLGCNEFPPPGLHIFRFKCTYGNARIDVKFGNVYWLTSRNFDGSASGRSDWARGARPEVH